VFRALDQRDRNHAIEKVGRELRAMMSWVKSSVAQQAVQPAIQEESPTSERIARVEWRKGE